MADINATDFPVSLNVNYTDVKDKVAAKLKVLKDLGDEATDKDRSFNVQLEGMEFNSRNVSALLTLDTKMTITSMSKLNFTRVVKYSEKLKTDIMFYVIGASEGTCSWKAV